MAAEPQGQKLFRDFLSQYFPGREEILLAQFDQYLAELYTRNQKVNMISRQMSQDDYFLYHFLDSLLIFKCMDIQGGKTLDFGSGGGLPGLPLKLALPELDMTLLDSVGKKVRCLQEIIAALKLKGCRAVWSRLEDFARDKSAGKFDYVFCRSVRLEPGFIEPLHRLLSPGGQVVFYKATRLEDVEVLPELKIYDVSLPELGTRQIVLASRRSLELYLKQRKSE